jgi:preprotein translocase subunit SecE
VARNRKRARERRRAQPVVARPGEQSLGRRAPASENGAPDPLEHATPDVELADAQLAMGRGEPGPELDAVEDEELDELATVGSVAVSADAAPAPARAAPGRSPSLVSRFATFLRGVWIELQRVQWPDRRQVMQATGVVIGFVIVAGLYLGVADYLAGKLMTFILK